jgi:regulator of nucleoside diphosphate kinase
MYAHPLLLETVSRPALERLRVEHGRIPRLASAAIRQTVLLPIDGTQLSDKALGHVIALAGSSQLCVHLLNVQPPVTAADVTLFTSAKSVEMQRRAEGERALAGAKRALRACSIDYVAEVAFGSRADEIVRCATSSGCSKIVMGTRGKGLVSSLLRGSVAHRVIRLAPVPVTLVTPNAVVDSNATGNVVTMNSRVLFEDVRTQEKGTVTVVYPADADPSSGKISVLSPVGAALLGESEGGEVELPLPHGQTRRIRIDSVLYQPEAQGDYAL